jgi:glycine/D-amino acid oxidase-like deaminating enzyme
MGSVDRIADCLRPLTGQRRLSAHASLRGILPEIERVLAASGIECGYQPGGGIFAAARYPRQEPVQRQHLDVLRSVGFRETDYRWLSAAELAERLNIRRPFGAIFTPHIARIQPAALARGLAETVERLGVDIYEQTRALAIGEDAVQTDRGWVRAPTRIIAVEGFNYEFAALRNRVLPVSSRILATAPLNADQWSAIGLADREVFSDASPVVTYGQRSVDDRLVFGARGAYRYGGRPRSDFSGDRRAFEKLHTLLLDCLPQLEGVPITHRWGGTLGVARGPGPHAIYDPVSGLGTAGGYAGEGVGASNLMARTLVDLLLKRESELVGQPWAHRCPLDRPLRRWQPEPLRWLGYQATRLALGAEESVGRREWPAPASRLASGVNRLLESLRY